MLLLLTPVFAHMPLNALAAIVITGVLGLLDFGQAAHLYRVRLPSTTLKPSVYPALSHTFALEHRTGVYTCPCTHCSAQDTYTCYAAPAQLPDDLHAPDNAAYAVLSAHCKDSPSLSAGWGSLTSQWCLQVSKADCAVWLLTFAGCLFISIDAGLGLGIGLGLVLLFARTAFAKSSVLARLPGSCAYRDAELYSLQARAVHALLLLLKCALLCWHVLIVHCHVKLSCIRPACCFSREMCKLRALWHCRMITTVVVSKSCARTGPSASPTRSA